MQFEFTATPKNLHRSTIADGKLLQKYVIKPLSSRDETLLHAINEIYPPLTSVYTTVNANSAQNWNNSKVSGYKSVATYKAGNSDKQYINGGSRVSSVLNISAVSPVTIDKLSDRPGVLIEYRPSKYFSYLTQALYNNSTVDNYDTGVAFYRNSTVNTEGMAYYDSKADHRSIAMYNSEASYNSYATHNSIAFDNALAIYESSALSNGVALYGSLAIGKVIGTTVGHSIALYNAIAESDSFAMYNSSAYNYAYAMYDSFANLAAVAEYGSSAYNYALAFYNSTAQGHGASLYNSYAYNNAVALYDSNAITSAVAMHKSVAGNNAVAMWKSVAMNHAVAMYDSSADSYAVAMLTSTAAPHSVAMLSSKTNKSNQVSIIKSVCDDTDDENEMSVALIKSETSGNSVAVINSTAFDNSIAMLGSNCSVSSVALISSEVNEYAGTENILLVDCFAREASRNVGIAKASFYFSTDSVAICEASVSYGSKSVALCKSNTIRSNSVAISNSTVDMGIGKPAVALCSSTIGAIEQQLGEVRLKLFDTVGISEEGLLLSTIYEEGDTRYHGYGYSADNNQLYIKVV